MKIKERFINLKEKIKRQENILNIVSLVLTLLFSFYNRIIGATKESLWHESISIYYFVLVVIKAIIVIYKLKSKDRTKDAIIFKVTKCLLLLLNVLLIVPIALMIFNKRLVEISFVFSLVIALYVTLKTIKSISNYIKNKKEDTLTKELKVIELTDCVVSILTLQNTLIAINSDGFDEGLYYLCIISSITGFIFNIFIIIVLKNKKDL